MRWYATCFDMPAKQDGDLWRLKSEPSLLPKIPTLRNTASATMLPSRPAGRLNLAQDEVLGKPRKILEPLQGRHSYAVVWIVL